MSSLMEASENGHEEVVKMLLSAGAKPDLQDVVSGTSPAQGHVVICSGRCSFKLNSIHVA